MGGHCGGGGTSHYSVSLSAYGSFPRFSWRPATLMLTRMLRLTAVTTTINMKVGEEEENWKLVYTSRPAWALVLILQSLFFLKPIFFHAESDTIQKIKQFWNRSVSLCSKHKKSTIIFFSRFLGQRTLWETDEGPGLGQDRYEWKLRSVIWLLMFLGFPCDCWCY